MNVYNILPLDMLLNVSVIASANITSAKFLRISLADKKVY